MSNSILDEIKNSEATRIKVAITDMDGILRGKYIHRDKFLSAVDSGFGFCNVVFGWDCNDVCYDNTQYTGWHTGYPDAQAQIDLDTFRKIPWDNDTPFFLADFINEHQSPLEVCPRQLLKKVIQKAKDMGFEALFGLEFEWFNFNETPQSLAEKKFTSLEPLTPGMFGYSVLRSSYNQPYFSALLDDLTDFKIPIEGIHTETGPGVFEAALLYSGALEAADRGVLFKSSVKEIAYRFEITPSFMAKWNSKLPGCSGHMHQSLINTATGESVFYNSSDPNKMSEQFKSYVAGQMALMPELLPFYAPNVNSYKRLVEGLWAPTKVTWGTDNRTSALRVISGSSKSTRLETRVSGSDMNPYLGIAAALASGLYGIEKNLKLKDTAVTGNAYQADSATELPKNLWDATENLDQSQVATELFGETFVQHFVNSRRWEWRQFQQAVTNWEMERYFEII